MALTAGALSQVSVSSNSAVVQSAVATMGTAPYTYQWYRSTTTGFSPGAGNLIAGATSLNLSDSGLIPNTTYFYVVKVTDSASPVATANSSQLTVTTTATQLSQNQFAMAAVAGQLDLTVSDGTVSAQVDASANAALLYQGMAVKVVPNTSSPGGLPRVIACAANTDTVAGFVNYSKKDISFGVGQILSMSQAGNVMWLYATAAITQYAQVCLDVSASASVQPTGASPAAAVVGYAIDGAAAAGTLIRVKLKNPSFATA